MRTLILLFLLLPATAIAQIVADPHSVNFGVIEKGTDRVVDIVLSNKGDKSDMFLRAGFTFEYDYLFSSKSIAPDSSITLRVKFNPREKGPFKEKVEIWFANMNRSLVIEFIAQVNYIDNSENPACPDFRTRPEACCNELEFAVEVRDRLSGQPVRNAEVSMLKNGAPAYRFRTDRSGFYALEPEISWYYFDVKASGYARADTAGYVNRRNSHYLILLDPLESTVSTAEPEEPEVQERPEITISPKPPVESLPIEEPVAVAAEPERLPEEEGMLPAAQFKRNNLVFLVDVSQSMANKGKLDLLKASVYQLSRALRPIDRIAVVTYASEAKVVLESIDGSRKDEIWESVSTLEAGGMTMGVKGFDKAYDVLSEHFSADGNNQLIVVTDGAFRSSDNPRILKMVAKQKESGVVTSVLGIKGNALDAGRLELIALEGSGNYLALDHLDDANAVLLNEVKRQSAMNK